MTNKPLLFTSFLLIVAMIAAAWWTVSAGVAPAELPVHWDASGHADGFAGPWMALLMAPGLTLAISIFIIALPKLEPRRNNLARSSGLYSAIWAGLLIVFSAVDLMVLGAAWKWPIDNPRILMGAIALMLVLLGNQLGKSRSTYLAGIRTPWTLADEDIWIATHRLAGKLFVGCGLLWLVAALSGLRMDWAFPPLLTLLLAATGAPVVYSWWLWRRTEIARENDPKV